MSCTTPMLLLLLVALCLASCLVAAEPACTDDECELQAVSGDLALEHLNRKLLGYGGKEHKAPPPPKENPPPPPPSKHPPPKHDKGYHGKYHHDKHPPKGHWGKGGYKKHFKKIFKKIHHGGSKKGLKH